MCSKQNRRFKSKHAQSYYRNKWSKTLTKHISYQCKCKFDGRKCNSNQKSNNNECLCKCKNKKNIACVKIRFGILLHLVVKMENI